jgi:hypothetical protein
MVGHSYGGWVVMNLAEAGVKSTAIFGLDPIDGSYCLASSNFLLGLGIESAKCKMAPYMNYAAIGASTQKFYQLWQPLGPIHSMPINRPFVVNHQFDINQDSFGGYMSEKTAYAHRMIGSEPSAWGVACHTIFKLNQWNTSACRMIETDGDGRFESYVNPPVPARDISGISIPDPATIPAPASRYTCTKTPQGPNGPINWRVSVVKSPVGWHIDAKRIDQHLYDEKETTRILGQELTENGLTNFVHASKTLWLSLKPVGSGNYVGRFYTQKYNYDIKDMTCREGN